MLTTDFSPNFEINQQINQMVGKFPYPETPNSQQIFSNSKSQASQLTSVFASPRFSTCVKKDGVLSGLCTQISTTIKSNPVNGSLFKLTELIGKIETIVKTIVETVIAKLITDVMQLASTSSVEGNFQIEDLTTILDSVNKKSKALGSLINVKDRTIRLEILLAYPPKLEHRKKLIELYTKEMDKANFSGNMKGKLINILETKLNDAPSLKEALIIFNETLSDLRNSKFPSEIKDDLLQDILKDETALKHAPDCFKNDKAFILKALELNGDCFIYVGRKLLKDREVVLAAIKKDATNLMFAGDTFRMDRSFIMELVQHNGLALHFADHSFKEEDDEIIAAAIKQNPAVVKFVYPMTIGIGGCKKVDAMKLELLKSRLEKIKR